MQSCGELSGKKILNIFRREDQLANVVTRNQLSPKISVDFQSDVVNLQSVH